MGDKVTVLPPAGREEQIKRWGLPAEHVGQRYGRRERFLVDASPDDGADDEREQQLHEFLVDGGWTAIDTTRGSHYWSRTGHRVGTPGAVDAGMSAHRGVLHPDEHVDADALRSALEAELGFSPDAVHAVYRQGRKSDAQLDLRARIDARLLELAKAGANMAALGRALGFSIKEDGHCRVLENALTRARKEHV